MDSEPVAWLAIYHGEVYDEAIGITRSVVEAQADHFGWESALTEIIPLYATPQPAPELTATVERLNASGYEYEGGEVTPQNAAAIVDTLLQQLDDAVQCRNAQPAPVVPDERPSLNNGIVGFDEGWNACRAAMLQAGNSPVIPDTWIPVSERLPEFGDYLVTDGCDFDVQLFNGEEFIPGFIWEDKITHWMPLPTVPPAPTQENI
ncbi:TPA: DUF551 domain-containing protein [Klebsiella aerogenes]|nr:DUF551 domain-containing protein [Klebsiella aerogenes]